jgi:hypothetical protein
MESTVPSPLKRCGNLRTFVNIEVNRSVLALSVPLQLAKILGSE